MLLKQKNMAQLELLQERFLSGTGRLVVPENKKARYYILYLDVIRRPKSEYVNANWNPRRGKYAFLTFLRNGYVIFDADMAYLRQSYDNIADISGQTLYAVKCAYDGILTTFVNLGIALQLPPIQRLDLIKDFQNLNLTWDEVRINCYADTAIQARLYKLPYDVCNEEFDDQFFPPPPPPPRAPVPPGTPIADLSPPYSNIPGGDNITSYFPGDQNLNNVLPPSIACQRYRVTIAYTDNRSGNQTRTIDLWGRIVDWRVRRGQGAEVGGSPGTGGVLIEISCQGVANIEPCGALRWVRVAQQVDNPATGLIASFTNISVSFVAV